jgi:hypothetical protein
VSAVSKGVPTELESRAQWVLWRREERGGRTTKVPYNASDPSRGASSTDPATWATLEQALKARRAGDGVGFVFSPDDPFVGVDLDESLGESGELEPWAAEIVARLDSYTERSPSGRGLHILVRGRLGGSRRRHGNFETYDRGRYFTVTGERVGTRDTVEERQAELDDVLEQMLPKPAPTSANGGGAQGLVTPDDGELLARAFGAKNGSRVEALYRGEINGYGSQSEAELGLCSSLAFWTGPDPARLDRLFRSSGLMRPKWDSGRGGSTYGGVTIERALERGEFYEGPLERSAKATSRFSDGVQDHKATEDLAQLLGLPSVGLTIVGARIVGKGSRASADLYLSDGSEVTFETLRDFANPTRLAVEIAACTGATPSLKAPMALRAMALLRSISERRESFTADQIAFDWGATYLQSASTLEADMNDREGRWRAFSELERHDPWSVSRERGGTLAHAGKVLVHMGGTRFVRCGWFHSYVRTMDASAGGNADIAQRMERIGWLRRGTRGRIKATRQGFPGQLAWSFFEVPKSWEDGE